MNKPHILYVEDDLNLGYVTQDNLQINGFEVLHCQNGQEALDAIESQHFDLCLLDIMLPKVDGFEVAKNIRQTNLDMPILFLTAKSLKADKIEGLKLGADDYITKPFSIEELILKINVFLKRSKVYDRIPQTESYQIGKYTFKPTQLQLSKNGQIKVLTAKEAELLKTFAKHPNQVLKRAFLLQQVWGDDDYFMGRSMDVFISRLRGYLKEDNSLQIKNVHGVGFVFEVL